MQQLEEAYIAEEIAPGVARKRQLNQESVCGDQRSVGDISLEKNANG